MFGAVGPIAELLTKLVDLFTNEDKLPEIRKRRELARLRKDCEDALRKNDWPGLAAAAQRLRDAATKP